MTGEPDPDVPAGTDDELDLDFDLTGSNVTIELVPAPSDRMPDVRGRRRPRGALPRAWTPRARRGRYYAPLVPQPNWITFRRRVTSSARDYASIARYDEVDLPLDALTVISDDTVLAFGWLASRAFWVWQQVVSVDSPAATTLQAYNSFPAPALGRKDRQALEDAAHTVMRSRSYLMGGSLDELYASMPEQLAWAHGELDTVTDRLLGIPESADDEAAATVLLTRYRDLVA